MRLSYILCALFLVSSSFALGQKKTDLLEDLKALNELVNRKEDEINRLKKSLVGQETLNQTYLFEIENLKTTNTALMKRLSNFTSQSVSNIMNIGEQIESMRVLEKQDRALRSLLTTHDSLLIEAVSKLAPIITTSNGMRITEGEIEINIPFIEYALKDSLHLDGRIQRVDSVLRAIPNLELSIVGSFSTNVQDTLNQSEELLAPKLFQLFTATFNLSPRRIRLEPTMGNDTIVLKITPPKNETYRYFRATLKR